MSSSLEHLARSMSVEMEGTGFVIHHSRSATFIITNRHVTELYTDPRDCYITDAVHRHRYPFRILAESPRYGPDIALIKVEGIIGTPATFSSRQMPGAGERAHYFGFAERQAFFDSGTFNRRSETRSINLEGAGAYVDLYDMVPFGGNSGSAILNDTGSIIGLYSHGDEYAGDMGMSVAIPGSLVMRFLDQHRVPYAVSSEPNSRSRPDNRRSSISSGVHTELRRSRSPPRRSNSLSRHSNFQQDAEAYYGNSAPRSHGTPVSYHNHHAPSRRGSTSVVPPVWQPMQDEEGRAFYYNTRTGQTTWDRPSASHCVSGRSRSGSVFGPSRSNRRGSRRGDEFESFFR